jgi:hypothetical protein
MDVIEIVRTVFRRWYVMVPVLLLTAGLAYTVVATAESQYETTGSFLLTQASLVGGDQGGGGTTQVSVSPAVIAEVVQGDEVRARVRDQGGSADYDIETGDEGLLRVTAAGATEDATVRTAQLVVEQVAQVLAERQDAAEIPEQRRITSEVLSTAAFARQQVTGVGTEEESVRYVARGSVRLVGPGDQGANPYAASTGGTIRVLEEVLASPQVRRELRDAGAPGEYEVGARPRDTAPIVYVVGRATSPDGSMQAFSMAVDRLRAELRDRQEAAGAASATMLTFEPLSIPTGAALVGGELRRPLIVIVGLGLVAAVSLAILVEGLASRARSRRSRRAKGPFPPGGEPFADGDQRPEPVVPQPVPRA